MELARQLRAYGETCAGLEQYAIQRFATAFHTLPKALAENAGVKSNEVRRYTYKKIAPDKPRST